MQTVSYSLHKNVKAYFLGKIKKKNYQFVHSLICSSSESYNSLLLCFDSLPFLSYNLHHSFLEPSYNTEDLFVPVGVDWFFLVRLCLKCVTAEK